MNTQEKFNELELQNMILIQEKLELTQKNKELESRLNNIENPRLDNPFSEDTLKRMYADHVKEYPNHHTSYRYFVKDLCKKNYIELDENDVWHFTHRYIHQTMGFGPFEYYFFNDDYLEEDYDETGLCYSVGYDENEFDHKTAKCMLICEKAEELTGQKHNYFFTERNALGYMIKNAETNKYYCTLNQMPSEWFDFSPKEDEYKDNITHLKND